MTRRRRKKNTLSLSYNALLIHFLTASTEEKTIVDAINKQKSEVNRQQEEVMDLLDRVVEEIEKQCPEGR